MTKPFSSIISAVKSTILPLLGRCPKCGSRLAFWRGCSHSPAKDMCENCGWIRVYTGVAASGISFPINRKCKCGENMVRMMVAGESIDVCPRCGRKE